MEYYEGEKSAGKMGLCTATATIHGNSGSENYAYTL